MRFSLSPPAPTPLLSLILLWLFIISLLICLQVSRPKMLKITWNRFSVKKSLLTDSNASPLWRLITEICKCASPSHSKVMKAEHGRQIPWKLHSKPISFNVELLNTIMLYLEQCDKMLELHGTSVQIVFKLTYAIALAYARLLWNERSRNLPGDLLKPESLQTNRGGWFENLRIFLVIGQTEKEKNILITEHWPASLA